MSNKKSGYTNREQRKIRTQQIIMSVIGILVILSMVITLFIK